MPSDKEQMRSWGDWRALDRKAKYVTPMSAVWRVRKGEGEDGDVFALKEMRYSKGPGSTGFKRFSREIGILGRLDHPGIVRIVDSFLPNETTAGTPYYVMPLAETTLARAAPSFAGNIESTLKLGIEVASALGAAHDKGIVHRDVKPANILLAGDARVPIVADFGIGYLTEDERFTRIEAGTVGTDDFVAPELEGGGVVESVKASADVYSFGKTLYAAISGGRILKREALDDPKFDLARMYNDPRMEHVKAVLKLFVAYAEPDRLQSMAECGRLLLRATENIRAGVPYAVGTYEMKGAPVERYTRLLTDLEREQGHRKADVVRVAVRDVSEAATRIAEAGVAQPGALRGGVGMPIPQSQACAQEAAEHMLSVGLALVQANSIDDVDEWLAPLRSWVRAKESSPNMGERHLLPPAAMLAVASVGAIAWELRRVEILGALVKSQLDHEKRWIHHYVLGENARGVFPWLVSSTKASAVIKRSGSSIVNAPEEWLAVFGGLCLLASVLAAEPAEVASAEVRKDGVPVTSSFPAYYHPAWIWSSVLPRAFSANPRLEKDVADKVFAMTSSKFKSECGRVTPALRLTLMQAARAENRWPDWGHFGFAEGWDEWCGKKW